MAKKSGSETGLVITLIVFILLAIAGIGFAIHFYHQWQLSNSATEENQRAFQQHVEEMFQHAGWDITRTTDPEYAAYGLNYTSDTYSEVAEKLELAIFYENMQPLLPWQNEEQVREALEEYSPEDESYNRVQALLSYMREENQRLVSRVDNLDSELSDTQERLSAREETFSQNIAELRENYEAAKEDYEDRIETLRGQYSDMEDRWEEARKDTWPTFESLRDRANEMKQEAERAQALREEAERNLVELQERFEPPERPDKFYPEGFVVAAERGHDEIILYGGEAHGRHRGEDVVIYYARGEDPVYVGSATVSRVDDDISMAIVTDWEHPIMEGHMFVKDWQWEERDPARPIVRVDEVAEWRQLDE